MKTGIITYNLRERGRKYRGQERNFNVAAIANAINSKETQERVKNRDMLGYYGHWSRIKFGMNPSEGKIDGGQVVHVEPALVTTHLRATLDGTVEHQAEFLPTKSGQLAYKLFTGKAGGFSSAIDTALPEFHGFDYVLEPNYTTNRGYTFDSVCEGGLCGALTDDEIDQAIYGEQMAGMFKLVESFESFKSFAMDAIENMQKSPPVVEGEVNRFVKPKMIPIASNKHRILDSAKKFHNDHSVDLFFMDRVTQAKPPKPVAENTFLDSVIKGFTKR